MVPFGGMRSGTSGRLPTEELGVFSYPMETMCLDNKTIEKIEKHIA